MMEIVKLEMDKLCEKNKEYYDNLPIPRFECFFTYDEGEQTGIYVSPEHIKEIIKEETDENMRNFLLNNCKQDQTLLKVSTCLIGCDEWVEECADWWTENDGKILFGYMKEDCEAVATFTPAQQRAFETTCKNYQHIIFEQAAELSKLREKMKEQITLMMTMNERMIDDGSDAWDTMTEYYTEEIDKRINEEEEIRFITEDENIINCLEHAVEKSKYKVVMNVLPTLKCVWVKLSDD